MKKILIVLMLVAILSLIVGCSAYQGQAKEPMIAMVRYFDGTADTLEITEYRLYNGSIAFKSIDGVTTVMGANNVIIIKGDKWE